MGKATYKGLRPKDHPVNRAGWTIHLRPRPDVSQHDDKHGDQHAGERRPTKGATP